MMIRVGRLALCLGFVVASVGAAQEAPTNPGAVATVNGEPLFFEDVKRQLQGLHSGASETQRTAFDIDSETDARHLLRTQDGFTLQVRTRALGCDFNKARPFPV